MAADLLGKGPARSRPAPRRARSAADGDSPPTARHAKTARPAPGSPARRPARKPKAHWTEAPKTPPAQAAGPPELSEKQRKHLRGLAHDLRALVRLGNAGLTEAVAKETARALEDHELIKVKAQAADRQARDALFDELAKRTASTLVHRIGHIAVFYRPRSKLPRILIPD